MIYDTHDTLIENAPDNSGIQYKILPRFAYFVPRDYNETEGYFRREHTRTAKRRLLPACTTALQLRG